MATPHPVAAPYPIQLFSHPTYVFGRRNASLPKLTLLYLRRQSFRNKRSHICYASNSCPHAYRQQYSYIYRFFLRTQKEITFLIFKWFLTNTACMTHIFCIDILLLFFLCSFFECFMCFISISCIEDWLLWFLARLEVNLMMLRVITFFHTFFPCWCNL